MLGLWLRSPEKALGLSYGKGDDVWALALIVAGFLVGMPLEDWLTQQPGHGGGGLFALDRKGVETLIREAQGGPRTRHIP